MAIKGSNGLLTVQEAAAELRLTPLTVYRAISRGSIRAIRIADTGRIRISSDELERLLSPSQTRHVTREDL